MVVDLLMRLRKKSAFLRMGFAAPILQIIWFLGFEISRGLKI